jgi:hypothetical protein
MTYSGRILCGIACSTLLLAPRVALAQANDSQHQHPAEQSAASDAGTHAAHEHMMRMMSEMKAADAKLDTLVQAMNAATGAGKTDAIAAVVAALVEQRQSMHGSMAAMMQMMGMMHNMGAMHAQETAKPKP